MIENTVALAKKLRRHAVEMTHRGRSSHVGSILSMVDIIAVLYGGVLSVFPSDPKNKSRDRFILSKGHAGAGIYAALAERGFFSTEKLRNHYKNGSFFSGHVSHKSIPGVELSTGSLGHGLSVGVGMAMAAKRSREKHWVHVVLSDGECDEGSNWEAFMFSAHHKLDNLIVSIDHNGLQSMDSTFNTLSLEPLQEKLEAFGWHVLSIDGHDHQQLLDAFESAQLTEGKPSVLICNTVKGKGVSFMENSVLWHYRTPQGDEYVDAIAELELDGRAIDHA